MASTAREQLLLELVNEARLNPMANAARYITSFAKLTSSDPAIENALAFFKVDGGTLKQQLSQLQSVQPLAWNDKLATAARGHNAAMIAVDTQAHDGIGDGTVGSRVLGAGFDFATAGENIYAFSQNPLEAHAAFMVDWGGSPATGGMQSPAGHRLNIMSADFREIGVGITLEDRAGTAVGPQVVTQDFGTRLGGPQVFILGVAYRDSDNNNFYSVGEGRGSLDVSLGGRTANSSGSGGYTLTSNDTGAQTITFSGAGLAGTVAARVNLSSGMNAKFDVIDGDTLQTSISARVSGPIDKLIGLGTRGLELAAGSGAQKIFGTQGKDELNGGRGSDKLHGGLGIDKLIGSSGSDTFFFETRLGSGQVDVVADFSTGEGDSFTLARKIFTEIARGELSRGAFVEANRAQDDNDRIVHDAGDGRLLYDPDGQGGKDAILFAILDKQLNLDHNDFLIV